MNRVVQIAYVLVVILVVGALLFSRTIAGFVTDWWWFQAIGYEQVFRVTILARAGMGAFCGLLAAALIYANAGVALRNTRSEPVRLPREMGATPLGNLLRRTTLGVPIAIVAALAGAVMGVQGSTWWDESLLLLYGSSFGFADPILSLDASFYVFTLPVLVDLKNFVLSVLVIGTILSGVVYLARGAVQLDFVEVDGQFRVQRVRVSDAPRRHLAGVVVAGAAVVAIGMVLQIFAMLYAQGESALFAGPGYADVYGRMPLLVVQALLVMIAGFVLFAGISRSDGRYLAGGAALVVLGWGLANFYPQLLQRFSVLPNEMGRETPLMMHHIAATRHAYDLERVELASLSGDAELSRRDIDDNKITIDNVRLWDHGPLLDTFSQVQEIRTYYEFVGVDNDRYRIDGELRQIMLSPRELLPDGLPEQARTWVNETMTYTHGYGLALGPVNEVTPQGLPELFVKDLPPKVAHPDDLRIDRPEIYYGEAMETDVFVDTRNKEFDYPTGEANVYTEGYAGKGGVGIGGIVGRALFSIRMASMKLMLSGDVSGDTKVLLYRDVMQRLDRIAPFLWLDSDPYLVIDDGRLVWVLDAYTTSHSFPYSDPWGEGGPNYIRNSVKATVDAFDGTVTLYMVDDADPIVRAWAEVFPDLFQSASAIPEGLRAHLRYPQDLFTIQAHQYAIYHMVEPQVFYNREDEWEIPTFDSTNKTQAKRGSARDPRRMMRTDAPLPWYEPILRPNARVETMAPYYTVMKLPDGNDEEYIVMMPFTPRNKPNLAAWMVARMDGDEYGTLRVYKFPKDKMVYGPRMIVARINQNDKISEKLSLWNQQGSTVELGTLLVIPIEESLIYVQPLYLKAAQDSIPELKRVIVGYENQIAMEPTLDEALAAIFPAKAPPVAVAPKPMPAPGPDGVTPAPAPVPAPDLGLVGQAWPELAGRAQTEYALAQDALKRGDWAAYGQHIDALGQVLEQLKAVSATPEPQ